MLAQWTGLSGTAVFLLLLALSLALVFAGGRLVKGLAFIVGGLVMGSVGASLATTYLTTLGSVRTLLGGVVGFLLGGFSGLALVYFGIGVGIGCVGYEIANSLSASEIISVAAGFVFFAIGFLVASKIISVATAVLGAIIFYDLSSPSLGPIASATFALVVGILGILVQSSQRIPHFKKLQPTPTQNAR